MWMVSSCAPDPPRRVLDDARRRDETCVGNRWLPRSGGWRGTRRPSRTAALSARSRRRAERRSDDRSDNRRTAIAAMSHDLASPVSATADVKLFCRPLEPQDDKEIRPCRIAPPARPGTPASSFSQANRFATTARRAARTIRHLIDEGFQAFNAGRLSEACADLRRQDARARERHDHRPDDRRRHDAGRARRLRHRADGPRPGRLHHLHRREPLSRPALRAELHAAARLAVRRRSRAVRRRRDPHLRRAVSSDGPARNRRLHPRFHRPRRDSNEPDRDLGVPLPARSRSAGATCPGCEEHSVVARAAHAACRSTPRRPATARSA